MKKGLAVMVKGCLDVVRVIEMFGRYFNAKGISIISKMSSANSRDDKEDCK